MGNDLIYIFRTCTNVTLHEHFSSPILAQMLRPKTFVREFHSFCADTNLADNQSARDFPRQCKIYFISSSPILAQMFTKYHVGQEIFARMPLFALMKICISLVYLGGQDYNGERLNFHFPHLYKCYTP